MPIAVYYVSHYFGKIGIAQNPRVNFAVSFGVVLLIQKIGERGRKIIIKPAVAILEKKLIVQGFDFVYIFEIRTVFGKAVHHFVVSVIERNLSVHFRPVKEIGFDYEGKEFEILIGNGLFFKILFQIIQVVEVPF